MKKTEIKTKKLSIVVYNNGYICIDGNYIVKADLVTLDNDLLQNKINKDEPFYYYVPSKNFGDSIPKLIDVIPAYNFNDDILQKTHLTTDFNRNKLKVFYNVDKRYFTYLNNDYLSIYEKIKPNYQLMQRSKNSGVAGYDGDILEFYIMPVIYKNCFLNIFEGVEV